MTEKNEVAMSADPRWVCDECGAIHWPPVAKAAGKCPTCGNPSGTVKKVPLHKVE